MRRLALALFVVGCSSPSPSDAGLRDAGPDATDAGLRDGGGALDAGRFDSGVVNGQAAVDFLDQLVALLTRRNETCGLLVPDASSEWLASELIEEVDLRAEMSRGRSESPSPAPAARR